jgi:predicted nucleotidyltransferase
LVGLASSSALGALDPRHVPLPNGTEVTTRAERVLDGRVVPIGAIGRVTASIGDQLDVRIVGVGLVRYLRDELLPRKAGQIRHAIKRAGDWAALEPCVVLEATVGSNAWGLAEAGSDHDKRGVFALPFSWTSGLEPPPRDLVSTDGSTTYWEATKMIEQGLRADPNTLEMLFVPSVAAKDPIGAWILEEREAFVSAELYASFGRYALSQLKKLEQSMRLAEHRATLLDWLAVEPTLELDAAAERLAKASIRGTSEADAIFRAKEYIKQLYRSLYDQGLIQEKTMVALAKLATEAHDFELPRELRPKNAYNLLRLIHTAIDWLETGAPSLEVKGALRERLLAIKHGEVSLAEVLQEAEAATPELEAARRSTKLKATADRPRIDRLLRKIAEELARRHLDRVPGPFGADAPPPPPVQELTDA